MRYTSEVLEVVRNGQNSIFLLILLNLSPNKSPFNQYFPKSVPNPDIMIILLLKTDKIVLLAIFFSSYLSNVNQFH